LIHVFLPELILGNALPDPHCATASAPDPFSQAGR
jgi:hypothetical protein